jgi:UDP-N-acetylglucosamine--N-acetylmuramyl-(pentapeptide) pyrophosphoryl-undecaprenol N-acetylglucosamine transferase
MTTKSAAPTTPSVMLAAGGTGGHLFPAFALAQELARRGIPVDLVTDMRGDRYGHDFPARAIYRVPAATLGSKNPVAVLKTGVTISKGLAAAYKLLGEVKPRAVIGFGGYPTLPPLVAARLRGIPSALHEQNAVLGRANKALSRRVTAIATSFERVIGIEGELAKKAHFTGNPVRDIVVDWSIQPYYPPGPAGPISMVVFGGSQGARVFADLVPPAIALLPEHIRERLFITQQARDEDQARVESAYAQAGIRALVAPFFTNLPEQMAKSQLVVGRAGASTIAELTVLGRPAILVPLPHALDNDQLNNARRLADAGAAWCHEQNTLTPETLAAILNELLHRPDIMASTAAAAKNQGKPDAVVRLANLVTDLMQRA